MYRLFLFIKNVSSLQKGTKVKHEFDDAGGSIGSDQNCNWVIDDYAKSVEDTQCQIIYLNENYCLKEIAGSTRINKSHKTLNKGALVTLKSGDLIEIGRYLIIVNYIKKGENFFHKDLSDLIGERYNILIEDHNIDDFILKTKTKGELLLDKKSELDPLILLSDDDNKLDLDIDDFGFDIIPKDNLGVSKKDIGGLDGTDNTHQSVSLVYRVKESKRAVIEEKVEKELKVKKEDIIIKENLDPIKEFPKLKK